MRWSTPGAFDAAAAWTGFTVLVDPDIRIEVSRGSMAQRDAMWV
jgi:hypothetical protein